MLLSLDLGTTHAKAGLFTREGEMVGFSRQSMTTHLDPSSHAYYDPQELWSVVIKMIREVLQGIETLEISAVGISSMAETGLLVDKHTGEPRSYLLPWYDARAAEQVKELERDRDPEQQFLRSGIRPNFKCGLSKLLWIRDSHPDWLAGTTWLSTADYIAFRLVGMMATDYSLAGRTYAFRIDELRWDEKWLNTLGLPAAIFPPASPSGTSIGQINAESASLTGLPLGTPVAICGHDHVCAAFAVAGTDTSQALDSMGTAEALVGSLDKRRLGQDEFQSGLVFGRHVAGNGYYWMGGMSTSGGALEWLRKILDDHQLSYQEVQRLLDSTAPGPTGIIFLPYLAGSGSPHTDIHMRGALIGLDRSHDRGDLIKAVLEGTAYEAEYIRRGAQAILERNITRIKAAGGGTKFSQWLQIKADVYGCEIEVPQISEATLLGAALLAGIGAGVYANEQAARSSLILSTAARYTPNQSYHQAYQHIYQQGFLASQQPIRGIQRSLSSLSPTDKS
jgi:xylulokinase